MIDEKNIINDIKQWSKEREIKWTTESVISLLESAPKIGGWIPCSERLPEIEQTVLLSLRSLDVSVGFRANTDGYFYTEGEGYVLYENVLAWQPLLEAYHE